MENRINVDDLQFVWRGRRIRALTEKEQSLIAPVRIENGKKERALLLLHGFSSTPAVFRCLLPNLNPCYDALVCPVLPGHGENLNSFAATRAQDWLLAAETACLDLSTHYKTVDVMGLSLGGLLACHLSTRFTLHHLYLLAPALSLHLQINMAIKLARLLKKAGVNYIPNRAGNLHTRQAYELAYRKLPLTSVIEILQMINTFQFKQPTCPVDLFLGRHDKVVNSGMVAKIFANQQTVTTHWLQHSAHILPLDGDTETIITCIRKNHAATHTPTIAHAKSTAAAENDP